MNYMNYMNYATEICDEVHEKFFDGKGNILEETSVSEIVDYVLDRQLEELGIPMCVCWKEKPGGEEQWCAVTNNQLDPEALQDYTVCDHTITLRVGHERRWPTCPECRKELGI